MNAGWRNARAAGASIIDAHFGFVAPVSTMNDSTVYVGLDAHKDSNVAAYATDLGEVQNLGNIGVRECDLDRLCKRMQSKGSRVRFVYEAGPTGYGLYRYLPKGMNMDAVTQQDCSLIAHALNHRTRKRLQFRNPKECFDEE